jgi:hypothetical protein
MNLIDMDRLRKELMAKGDIPIHEVFNTIWEQPIVNISQPSEDCISRKDVIKIFGEVHPLDYNKQSYIANIQKLPSTTPKARWIPCSERLPERDENVLTYHRNESFDYQYVSWIDDYSGKWAGFIGNLSDEVLAWMPLPEPYKEGDTE